MNFNAQLRIPLNPSPEQADRLRHLQAAFAEVCNALAPVVSERRLWNRVALHHLMYRELRERFPAMGSQMVCNAIYAVCRAARMIYQDPGSPFLASRLPAGKQLPLLRFAPHCPVYFDRHTLSLKDGQLSMYTLDGRMRFQLRLAPKDEARFRDEKLRELLLSQSAGGKFELVFTFATEGDEDAAATPPMNNRQPSYIKVEERA